MTKRDKADIWYAFFVGDYRRDTARLSCEQHGAYRQLIDEYFVTGPLPDDDEILARIVGLELRAWKKHRQTIVAFFKVRGGQWRHKRIDSERAQATSRKTKATDRARAAAAARWEADRAQRDYAQSNATSMPEACPEQCLGDALYNSPSPSPSSLTGSAYPIQEVANQSDSSSTAEIIPLDGRAGR